MKRLTVSRGGGLLAVWNFPDIRERLRAGCPGHREAARRESDFRRFAGCTDRPAWQSRPPQRMTTETSQEVAAETAAVPGFSGPHHDSKVEQPIFAKNTGLFIFPEESNRHLVR